jgi:arylsulfatase
MLERIECSTRTRIRVLIALAVCCVIATSSLSAAEGKAARPNVLLIMCDDLGYSDLGCYGGEIRTPHLDRLAAQGVRFTQFYNCAVCVMTRAALLTGLHPRQGGGSDGLLRENMLTLGEAMQGAGYNTSLVGKWHLGSQAPRRPIDRGFDEYYGLLSGCCNYFDPSRRDPLFYNGGNARPFAHNDRPVTEFPQDFYTTDAFSDHAIGQLRKLARQEKPFFLHLCYTAPHFPLHAPEEDVARYQGKYDDGYFKLRERRHARQVELGIVESRWKLSGPDKKAGPWRYDYEIAPWEEVEELPREKRRMEVYAAMVDRLDQGVGRVLTALDELGVAENTLVLFLSDNGGCATLPQDLAGMKAYNRELPGGSDTYDFCGPGWGWAQCTPFRRYKTWNHEGGIATPLIARWPATIAPGGITREVGHVVDFMPTLLELAGGEYPATRGGKAVLPVEGKSLVPVFQGKQRAGHEHLCWSLYGSRAVRQGKWKLVWGVSSKRWELYDMQADRTETEDLSEQQPDRVAAMSALWHEWAKVCEVEE